jgi:hypothetical protein
MLTPMCRPSLLLLLTILAACSRPESGAPAWTSRQQTIERKGGHFSLRLRYPVLEGAPATLNAQLAESALIHLEQVEDAPIPFEEYARNFATDSKAIRPDLVWKKESVLEVAHQGQAVLTTLCLTTSNSGDGPADFAHYENYAVADGRRLELSDLVEPGRLAELTALASAVHKERTGSELDRSSFPNEPALGFLKDHVVLRFDADTSLAPDIPLPHIRLRGIVRSAWLP